jgi:hypothetical protein
MEYEQELRMEDQELITRNYKEKNTNRKECELKRKRKGKEEKKNEMFFRIPKYFRDLGIANPKSGKTHENLEQNWNC